MAERISNYSGSSGLPGIAFAIFGVLLLIAFFANRGTDVGQLQNLIGNLGGGSLVGFEGILNSFVGTVAALLVGISWFGLGGFVSTFIGAVKADRHSKTLAFTIKTAIGAAAWSLIWFFVGLVGGYSKITAIVLTSLGIVLALVHLANVRRENTEKVLSEKYSGFEKALLAMIAVPVILGFIASLAPPTAKDTLLYHFAVPKAFIAQGSNAFIEGNIASYLALGTEMHVIWAMLLGGLVSSRAAETAAGAATFLFFPLVLMTIFGWSRELGISRRWSLITVLLMAGVPTVFHVASSGYADVALALFVTLAVYSLGRWWKTAETGSLILISIFLGAALAIKLTAVFVIAAFALMILLRARNSSEGAGKLVTGGFAALVLAGAIASPWYLRTWTTTGSPVFPFYMSIWNGDAPGWDVERSNLFQGMNSQYGGVNKTVLDYLAAPWNLSISAQPEKPENFDGVLGFAFLFGLPVLIFGLWKFDLPIEAKIGTGVAGIMFLFWLSSSQQLRYLLPVLPVLALAITAAAETIANAKSVFRQIWQYGFITASFAGILVSTAWFFQKAPIRVTFGGETRDQYLTRNLDYYSYYNAINTETATNAKVWLINMRRDTFHIDRPIFSDYIFEDWTLRKMIWDSRNVQEFKAKVAAMNVQYVLTRHDFLFDYDRSTLVDDKKSRGENEAKLKIAKEFILDPANTVRADKKFSLVKVF